MFEAHEVEGIQPTTQLLADHLRGKGTLILFDILGQLYIHRFIAASLSTESNKFVLFIIPDTLKPMLPLTRVKLRLRKGEHS